MLIEVLFNGLMEFARAASDVDTSDAQASFRWCQKAAPDSWDDQVHWRIFDFVRKTALWWSNALAGFRYCQKTAPYAETVRCIGGFSVYLSKNCIWRWGGQVHWRVFDFVKGLHLILKRSDALTDFRFYIIIPMPLFWWKQSVFKKGEAVSLKIWCWDFWLNVLKRLISDDIGRKRCLLKFKLIKLLFELLNQWIDDEKLIERWIDRFIDESFRSCFIAVAQCFCYGYVVVFLNSYTSLSQIIAKFSFFTMKNGFEIIFN